MVKQRDVLELINKIAPFDIAENWDNCGLQAGNLEWEVKKMMIGLDVSIPLLCDAKEKKCDVVLTHHPLMLKVEKAIDFNKMPGKAIEMAAKHNISIISAHTNLDKANNGLNDYFAARIGMVSPEIFYYDNHSFTPEYKDVGIGRIGYLEKTIPLKELVKIVKEKLALNHLRITGDMDMPVNTIAVCTGSGGSLIDVFINSGADVYITGDIKYHEARTVEQNLKAIIDVGHFGSEHMAVDLLFEKLNKEVKQAGFNIEIIKFNNEKDPFVIV